MGFLIQPQTFFSIGPNRSFGGISGYVTLQENAVDAIEITQQPVQQGANIADHAFKKPVGLSIQVIFKNEFFQSLSQVYASVLALQDTLEPFTVFTPKRTYFNMMLATIAQTTDKKTENVLAINCTFQEVIIVSVSATVIPRSKLKNPGNNGATQQAGKKSALLTLTQGIGSAFPTTP